MEENPNLYWHNPTWYTYRNDFAALFCLDGDTLTWYPSLGTRIALKQTILDFTSLFMNFNSYSIIWVQITCILPLASSPNDLVVMVLSIQVKFMETDQKFDIKSQNIRTNSIGFIYFRIFPRHTCLHAFAHWSRCISDWIGAGWDVLESHFSIRAWQAWGFGDKEPKVDKSTEQPVSISIWRMQRCGEDLES